MRLAFDENQKQSHFIIEKLKNDVFFMQSKKIGIYLSYNHEVDTWGLSKNLKDKKNSMYQLYKEKKCILLYTKN